MAYGILNKLFKFFEYLNSGSGNLVIFHGLLGPFSAEHQRHVRGPDPCVSILRLQQHLRDEDPGPHRVPTYPACNGPALPPLSGGVQGPITAGETFDWHAQCEGGGASEADDDGQQR